MGNIQTNRALEAYIKGYATGIPGPVPGGGGEPFPNTYSLDFDGVDDYVSMGNPTELQITGALTLSAWVKTSSATQQKILFKDDNTNRSYSLGLRPTSLLVRFGIFNGGSFTSVTSTSTIHDGDWHHIAAVFNPSTSMKVFIDGVLEATNTTSIPATIDNDPADFEIGRRGDSNYYWNGNVDEASIWDSALSDANVATLYNSGLPTDLKTALASTPVAWWRNGDSGTFLASEWNIPDQMKIDNWSSYSMAFDGVDDEINCGTNVSLQPTLGITLSCWFMIPTGSLHFGADTLISQDHIPYGGLYKGYYLDVTIASNGYLYAIFGLGDASSETKVNIATNSGGTPPYVGDTWYHLCGTWDGSDMVLYINGVSLGTTAFTGPIAYDATEETWIGNRGHNQNIHFVGSIDDVSIWNTGKSASEVLAIYNNGKPTDLSTFSLKSFAFDGVDDYINTGTSALDGATALTVSAWINTDYNNWQRLFGDNSFSFALKQSINRVDITLNSSVDFQSSNFSITLGQWHHVAVVYDASEAQADRIKLYLDGSLCNNIKSGTTQTSYVASSDFNIGRQGTYSLTEWNGLVDNFSVYDSAKSISEITTIYNSGVPKDESETANLQGYWKFDDALWDGTNFSVPDSSENSNTGTTANMDFVDLETSAPLSPVAYYRMGENGVFNANTEWELPNYQKRNYFSNRSMTFDGVDDYVDCGSFTHLNSATALTISVWFNSSSYSNLGRLLNLDDHVEIHQAASAYSNTQGRFTYILRGAYGNAFKTLGGTSASGVGNLCDGNWHHLCFVWDNSTTTAVIYEDGVAVITDTSTTGTLNSATDNFYIGADPAGANAIDGKIDDVSIFNVAKSASEVSAIFNSGVPKDESTNENLIGYWRMGEGATFSTNWTVPDDSSNSNNGTSANMDAADVVNQAPENMEQGLSVAMDEVDKINNAPDNTTQGRSVNMDEVDRSTEVPT